MCLRYTKQTVKDLEDIKTFFSKIVFKRVIVIFKRVSDPGFHYIEKCGAERITEESIVKVIDITPETAITVAALRSGSGCEGLHFKSLPKVWRTMIKPGVKYMDLFCLKNS